MKRFLPLLFLFSCSTLSYHSPGDYFGGALLGPGTYMEEVLFEPNGQAPFRFNTIFQRKADSALSSGLASGHRLYRVLDRFGKVPEIKFYPTELDAQIPLLKEFYESFRNILLLDDKPALPQANVRERYPDQRPHILASPEAQTLLSIDEYDWEGHAFRATVKSPRFTAKITLREYSPAP